jgi:DNA-binding MarR family transcriptional regulator
VQEPAAVETGSPARDASEDQIVLGVLDAVERDPSVTQRSVARELGIALGLANAYLRRCVRKGLIKVSEVPRRRYAYYLTPQGFAEKSRLTATYLSDSFSFFRKARAQCGDLFGVAAGRGQRRLALLGHGDLAEIASLVAREHPIEIVGVIAAGGEAGRLEAELAAVGPIDALVITALVDPRGALEAALRAFGAERVYVPAILRVPMPTPAAARPGEAA